MHGSLSGVCLCAHVHEHESLCVHLYVCLGVHVCAHVCLSTHVHCSLLYISLVLGAAPAV